MMKSDLFMHEVRQTSTVFGRKATVDVVFHGSSAATNGATIILPELARGVDVSDETATVLRGYTDHEAGHIRHSDMKLIQKKYGQWNGEGKTLLRSLHNALEDVWLEKRVIAEYPGAERNLRGTASAVNQEFLDRVSDGRIGPELVADMEFVGPVALTWQGRRTYGGPTCDACLDLLPDEMQAKVHRWVGGVAGCKSTKDVVRLAEQVYAEIKAEAGAEAGKGEEEGDEAEGEDAGDEEGGEGGGSGRGKGRKASDDGTPSEDGCEVEGGEDGSERTGEEAGEGKAGGGREGAGEDDEGGGEGAGKGSADGEGEGKAAGSKPKPGTGTGATETTDASDGVTKAGGAAGGKAETPYEDFDLKGAMERALEGDGLIGAEATKKKGYLPFSTKEDKWHHRKLDTDASRLLRRFDARQYDQALERMQGEVNAIRRKLERALVSKQLRDWDGGREAGRLDSRRFASVMAGRTNVFKQRTERAEIDTALTILVDLSGSMAGSSKDTVARDCVMAIVEAIDRTGVAYEVVGFDNRRVLPKGWDVQIKAGLDKGVTYARWEPLDMTIFKGFEDRLFEAKGGLYAIPQFVGGENTDGEAVLMAYSRLKARPERRKVLLTLSDGAPACRTASYDALKAHLRTAIETLRKDGCACMGVGIMDDAVSTYYPEYVVVESLADLAGEALGLLSKQLLGERVNMDRSKLMATGS